MKTTIGIFGLGYVGSAFVEFFQRRPDLYEVKGYDPQCDALSATMYNSVSRPRAEVLTCDVILIAVPTPTVEGEQDVSAIEGILKDLNISQDQLIILKSTVLPGTTARLRLEFDQPSLVFSPEYLGESKYWTPYDFHTQVVESPWFTFGGRRDATERCVDLYLPIAGPTKTYHQCSAHAAEFAKYLENTFYATKIAFCYEMAKVARAMGVSWNEAREAWLLDPRVGPMHTAVFRTNARPFGGKCLPKDTVAFWAAAEKAGAPATILEAVLDVNSDV